MLIALPKGRLLPEIKDLFYKIGIEFDENSRKLIIETSKENIKIAILRTWDIPKFVNYGVADVGIVGKDILFETDLENNYYEVLDLNIGICRLSLASLKNGGQAILTNNNHKTGTDRVYEALKKIGKPDIELIMNLQGDEPLMNIEDIKNLHNQMIKSNSEMGTLASKIEDKKFFQNENVVKVLT